MGEGQGRIVSYVDILNAKGTRVFRMPCYDPGELQAASAQQFCQPGERAVYVPIPLREPPASQAQVEPPYKSA